MAKLKTSGINETIKMLEALGKNTDDIFSDALKKGAGVATDSMRLEVKSLKTSDEYEGGNGKRYAKPADVKGLLDSLGFTPVKSQGTILNVNVGWDGYNSDKTKKYPNGHANRMIANAINKGTSFMIAQPFINKAKRKAESKCIDAIESELTKELKKISK